jgi:hypothetical protein
MIKTGMNPIWELVGVAIGLAVLAVVAGLSLFSAGTSSGITSAITQITTFLPLIGLGIAVGILTAAFEGRHK